MSFSFAYPGPRFLVQWAWVCFHKVSLDLQDLLARPSLRFDQVTAVQFLLSISRTWILRDAVFEKVAIRIIPFIESCWLITDGIAVRLGWFGWVSDVATRLRVTQLPSRSVWSGLGKGGHSDYRQLSKVGSDILRLSIELNRFAVGKNELPLDR